MALEDSTFVSDIPYEEITGAVLAGGRSRRMGGDDKGLVEIAGRPMVSWVTSALRPQCAEVVVNANRNVEAYRALGEFRVVSDSVGDYAGPLAGMLSVLREVDTPYLLTAPCDSPLVSGVLSERLYDALVKEDAELAVAHDGERMQPVFALIDSSLEPSIAEFLDSGERKIDRWFARHRLAVADFSDHAETFSNVNTPEEHALLEQRLDAAGGYAH